VNSKQTTPAFERGRILIMCVLGAVIGLLAYIVAVVLVALIHVVTNISFFHHYSYANTSPYQAKLAWWSIFIPAIGGLIVGIMAKYGSPAIRGHGIPEAMEQILTNSSRVSWKVALFKPISSAFAIGTGGPFGAEGPIIATGGALGSLVGQWIECTGTERKILLSAGAAAGMTAIFGSPISAVLLAIELLLFEFRLRSLAPVAIASATAMAFRTAVQGHAPTFPMEQIPNVLPSSNIAFALVLGLVMGGLGVIVSKAVYWVEDNYDRMPIHWMWWPALGGVIVGIIGLLQPRSLGIGYDNIDGFLQGKFTVALLLSLFFWKMISWLFALSSGTSGGTLAPIFTIGGCLGSYLGLTVSHAFPGLGIDAQVIGLVGMAALFSGASGALLASIVFALETTQQLQGAVPLLVGCTAAAVVARSMSSTTIMTEKIFRRGVVVPSEYRSDPLASAQVKDYCSTPAIVLQSSLTLLEARRMLADVAEVANHQGFPLVNSKNELVGVATTREILSPKNEPEATLESIVQNVPIHIDVNANLRLAANLMISNRIGRLPVVMSSADLTVFGVLTRSDLLVAEQEFLETENIRSTVPKPFAKLLKKDSGTTSS